MESGGWTTAGGVALADLQRARSWSPAWLGLLVRWLTWTGQLRRRGDQLALTETGQRAALRLTRNHRLFEQFLVTRAELAPSHVDRAADLVEHVLSPQLIAELEAELRTMLTRANQDAARAQWGQVADGPRTRFERLAAAMDAAEDDVLAAMSFHPDWTKVSSAPLATAARSDRTAHRRGLAQRVPRPLRSPTRPRSSAWPVPGCSGGTTSGRSAGAP